MTDSPDELFVLRQVAERYAVAVDRRDAAMFVAQFTSDGILAAPLGRFEGRDEIGSVIDSMAKRYDATFHGILTQAAEIEGEQASAETYCIARHFFNRNGQGAFCFEMTIRYQDRFAIEQGMWRLSYRELIVDATREFSVDRGTRWEKAR